MSNDSITVEVEDRKVIGKGLSKLRDGGQIPAVIHNHGEPSIHVSGDAVQLNKVYAEAGKHHPVEVKVGGQGHLTLIKDADFDPVKRRLRHIVFQAINRNETVEAEVPIVLEGDIPAEKASLMVITSLDTVQVEALPSNLPDEIKVDASVLVEVGDKISVAELQVPEGVTILTNPDQTIAHVEMPKDQIAEADAIAAEQAESAGTEEEAEVAESEETVEGEETKAKDENEEE